MVVTKHMLKKKIAQVNQETRYMNARKTTTAQQTLEEPGTVLLYIKKITKIQGDCVITENNKKAKLFNPLPCVYWKCTRKTDANGVSTLRKSLDGLFIDDGNNIYCIGVTGASDEFEIRCQIGTDEIRMNNLFINMQTEHFVRNGMEVKNE